MIQQSVLGARVCIIQLLRVTRLNEWICKHHVHIRSKLEWYLTASSLFFHARRLQEQSWPSAITSKLHVFHQGRTQETIQQFNLRVVGVVPAPRMLDWYQILTKAKIDQVNRWLRCGPGWSEYFTLCGWRSCRPLCRSLPKLLLANGSQTRQPGRADWYDSNQMNFDCQDICRSCWMCLCAHIIPIHWKCSWGFDYSKHHSYQPRRYLSIATTQERQSTTSR